MADFTHTITCACGKAHEIDVIATGDNGTLPSFDYPGDPPSLEVEFDSTPFTCECGVLIDMASDAIYNEIVEAARRELRDEADDDGGLYDTEEERDFDREED